MNYLSVITEYASGQSITEISTHYIVKYAPKSLGGFVTIIDRDADILYRIGKKEKTKEPASNTYLGGWILDGDEIIKIKEKELQHDFYKRIKRIWCTRKSLQDKGITSLIRYDFFSFDNVLLRKYLTYRGDIDYRVMNINRFDSRDTFPFLFEQVVINNEMDDSLILRSHSWSERKYSLNEFAEIEAIIRGI